MPKPLKYPDPHLMQKRIDQYFMDCDNKRQIITAPNGNIKVLIEPYTVSGLCLALDICRDALLEYSKRSEYADTIKKAKLRIESFIEKGAITGELNPTFSIFSLKNNFGWKDKTEHEVTAGYTLSAEDQKIIENSINRRAQVKIGNKTLIDNGSK